VVGWQRALTPEEGQAEWIASSCDAVGSDPALRVAECLVLYLPGDSFDQVAKEMGPVLGRVLAPFGARTLTFLHALRSGRWPTRRRSPPVLATSAAQFLQMGVGNDFAGGIRVPAEDAASVLEPLMWSVRMDMGYGLVYIAADNAPFVASLCQYGNLHVEVYAADAVATIREAARAAGLAEWPDGICQERFTGGAIPGRALSVGRVLDGKDRG
jgi:hypothetical protein